MQKQTYRDVLQDLLFTKLTKELQETDAKNQEEKDNIISTRRELSVLIEAHWSELRAIFSGCAIDITKDTIKLIRYRHKDILFFVKDKYDNIFEIRLYKDDGIDLKAYFKDGHIEKSHYKKVLQSNGTYL